MTTWLQSVDEFDALAEFVPETGQYVIRSRKKLDAGVAPLEEIDGSYSILSGVLGALYTYQDRLVFRLAEKAVVLSDDVVIEVSGKPEKRTLLVRRGNDEIIRHEYEVDESRIIPGDMTPFIDQEEEFDYGLFVSNVSKDATRKAVLLGKD